MSSSQSTKKPTGPCGACQKEGALLRCRPCRAVGIDIFFCNQDCQRKVWKTHKAVCGKDEFTRIEQAAKALYDGHLNNLLWDSLFSQAHEKLLKIASILEANKDMLMKNHADYYGATNVHTYEMIAELGIRRRNFEDIVHSYEFCDSAVGMTDSLYVLHCLALMVTGKKDSYQASKAALEYVQDFFSDYQSDQSKPDYMHSREAYLASLGSLWNFFLVELRRMKKWDEALDFTNKFGGYIEESKSFSSAFMQAVTYIERYRVKARKRPKDKRNWMSVSLYKNIFSKICEHLDKVDRGKVSKQPFMYLVLAQWTYLNHHCSAEQKFFGKDAAIDAVWQYIYSLHAKDSAMMNCIGCKQKSTNSDPLLICSGCRAVCYCCIDHQRSSWEKELDTGVGIGHKMLCPLHKAYRKWRAANEGNKEEYNNRFRKECEKFLSDSLGLRDLCFPQEFVEEHYVKV